jgi:TonB family protein
VVRDLLSDASSLSADVGAALAQSSGVAVARRDGAAPGLREGADRAASSGEGTAARVRGRVATGAVEMSGEPEDEVSIQRTMKRYTGRAKQCYERELKGDPGLAGKVSVSFDIDTFGRVTGVAVIQNTTGDAELAACIKRVVQRIRFNPPPEDDVEVSAYPFILSLQ